jgi:hypothetical protein
MVALVIVSAGMRRSGSTWLFNTLRQLCATQADVYSCFSNRYQHANLAPFHVIKCHDFIHEIKPLAKHVFVSRRDLRDIAASAVRRGMVLDDPEEIIPFLQNEITHFEAWRQFSTLEIPYEEVVDNKLRFTAIIADKLGVQTDVDRVERQVAELPIRAHYDRTTKLWPNHVTDGRVGTFQSTLCSKTVTAINVEFDDWLNNYGYE